MRRALPCRVVPRSPAPRPPTPPAWTASAWRETPLWIALSSANLPLDGARAPFARSYAHDLHKFEYKNLAIAHFAGLRGFMDRLDHLIHQRIVHRDFDFCLRNELDGIF